MELLLKNVRIVTGIPGAAEPNLRQDLLLRDGILAAIGDHLPAGPNRSVWDCADACVSPGWLDVGVHTGDPGYEHREDLQTAAAAAAAGGFTAVACFPNTDPALHSKSEVWYVKNKTLHSPVTFYPIGALSQHCAGHDLAELFDMHVAGAIAFSDGHHAVQDAGLLLRALQYSQAFNGLIINEPHHKNLAGGGQMHEGLVSTMLGLKGLPALAEEIMVQRDISLLEYAQGRLHLHLLSTANSVALVRAAKKAGLPVSCSVAVANLCFSDERLLGLPAHAGAVAFDTQWKLLPPLRTPSDTEALLAGLADGTIDFICSNHRPWDEESKNLEFPYAEFGMIGLETCFPLCRTFLDKQLTVGAVVEKLALAPRRVLGLPLPEIKVGARAELTVFDPDMEWIFTEKDIYSKSRNTPFVGQTFKGKVLGIVNGEKMVSSAFSAL